MKIAVVHNLPAGGMKRALYEQIKRLSERHAIDLFTLSTADESIWLLDPFVRHHEKINYKYPPHFPKSVMAIYKDLPKAYKLMAEKINKGGYDVVLVYPCYLTQAPFVLRYLTVPSVYYCPEPKREFYEKIERVTNFWSYSLTYPFRLPIAEIDKTNTRYATLVATLSQFMKKQIDEIYGINSKVNYLAVDSKLFKPLEIKKENMVMTVGELSLHKGHDFIIKSMAKIPTNIRPILTIVGFGGSEKKYLSKLAKTLGVTLVLKENISDRELVSLYNKARLFVYAAHSEPFGLVLLEAAACGLPAVAVDDGGVAEIVKNKLIGELVERDENKFSEIMELNLMRGEGREIKTKRHEYVEKNWSWEKSVEGLEKYLQEAR